MNLTHSSIHQDAAQGRADEASASMKITDRTCLNLTKMAREDDDSCPHRSSSKATSPQDRRVDTHTNHKDAILHCLARPQQITRDSIGHHGFWRNDSGVAEPRRYAKTDLKHRLMGTPLRRFHLHHRARGGAQGDSGAST